MPDASARSAFGTYLVSPDQLSHEERIGLVIGALPMLRFGSLNAYTARWLADGLESWLLNGGDLERHLGLRPMRGSHRRAATVYATRNRDQQLVRLSNAIGSDAAALRVLKGEVACPKRALILMQELRPFERPHSAAAFTRARARLARHPL